MKHIRKFLSWILAIVLLLSFVSCASETQDRITSGDASVTETPASGEDPATSDAPADPSVTEETAPAESGTQAATSAPEVSTTAAPEETTVPVTTAEQTQTPESSEAPATTQAPATAGTPETTQIPATTQVPKTTAVPETKVPPVIQAEPFTSVNAFQTQYLSYWKVDSQGHDRDGNTLPLAGYRYTADGFQMISPVYPNSVQSMTQVALREAFALDKLHGEEGHVFSVTFTVDQFLYRGNSGKDEWICLSLSDRLSMTPGSPNDNEGLFLLLRGNGDGLATVESHFDVGASFDRVAQKTVSVPMLGTKEVYTFTVDYDGINWRLSVNGQDVTPSATQRLNGKNLNDLLSGLKNSARFHITAQTAAVSDDQEQNRIAFTINRLNGKVPTGTEEVPAREYAPYVKPKKTPITSVTINGIPLKKFEFVLSSLAWGELPYFNAVRYFSEYCGHDLVIASGESSSEHTISFTMRRPDGKYFGRFETGIWFRDGNLYLGCCNEEMALKVLYTFFANYLNQKGDIAISIPEDGTVQYFSTDPCDWSQANPSLLTEQDRIQRSCFRLAAILAYDTACGRPFTYGETGCAATVDAARAAGNRVADDCALVNWVLRDAGCFSAEGEINTRTDGTYATVGFVGDAKNWRDRVMDVSIMQKDSLTAYDLFMSGLVLPGDILVSADHVRIMLSNGYLFDGGCFSDNVDTGAAGGNFTTWFRKIERNGVPEIFRISMQDTN